MRFVFNRKFVHHAHGDDAVEVRLWRALFSNGVVCRRNVSFHRLQQLHRGRQWIDVKPAGLWRRSPRAFPHTKSERIRALLPDGFST